MEVALSDNTGTEPAHVSKNQLRSIVERIERLEEEKKELGKDISEVYLEAKGNGYDVKVLRKVIAWRKQDPDARSEQEVLLETYLHALGQV